MQTRKNKKTTNHHDRVIHAPFAKTSEGDSSNNHGDESDGRNGKLHIYPSNNEPVARYSMQREPIVLQQL